MVLIAVLKENSKDIFITLIGTSEERKVGTLVYVSVCEKTCRNRLLDSI